MAQALASTSAYWAAGKSPRWENIFEDYLAVGVGVNFQWIALADAQGPADFLGYNNSSEIIDSSDDSCCFQFIVTSCGVLSKLLSTDWKTVYRFW